MGLPVGADPLAGEPRPLRLIEEAATLAEPGWLPVGTGWDGLDELAEEHRRLITARSGVTQERTALLARYEEEDRAHNEALRQGFRRGGDGALPEVTAAEDRRAAMLAVEQRHQAANDALDEFLTEAVEAIESRADGWLDTLAERRSGALRQREEAARLLAEAEEEEMRLRILEGWITRNAGRDMRPSMRITPTRFMPWDRMAVEYRPKEVRILDPNNPAMAQLEVVDTFPGAAQFAVDLNRGRVPASGEQTPDTEEQS